jgi:hypothetical protein
MTVKIKELTQEQKAMFPHYVNKWIDVGTCCEPADRKKAEEGLKLAYKTAKLKPPKEIIWCDSPLSGMLAVTAYFYAKENNLDRRKLTMKDLDEVIKLHIVYFCCFGQHSASWLSFYDFFEKECGLVEETKPLRGLKMIAESAGWWWCYKDVAFICERHTICSLDDQRLIHSDKGPAIAFKDGFQIFAIHGVMVPEYVVMHPEKIDVQDVQKEENMEVRRIKIDRMGVAKYLDAIGAEKIHEDWIIVDNTDEKDPISMPRYLLRDKLGNQYLLGTDGSTKRGYYMNVDPNAKTCSDAHQSISRMPESDIIANS